jgi:hypothetical protein
MYPQYNKNMIIKNETKTNDRYLSQSSIGRYLGFPTPFTEEVVLFPLYDLILLSTVSYRYMYIF